MELFEQDWGVDNSPLEEKEITSTILYFSKEELATFKALCKKGMKVEWPDNYREKGNLPDLLLKILEQKYGNH